MTKTLEEIYIKPPYDAHSSVKDKYYNTLIENKVWESTKGLVLISGMPIRHKERVLSLLKDETIKPRFPLAWINLFEQELNKIQTMEQSIKPLYSSSKWSNQHLEIIKEKAKENLSKDEVLTIATELGRTVAAINAKLSNFRVAERNRIVEEKNKIIIQDNSEDTNRITLIKILYSKLSEEGQAIVLESLL